MFLSDLVSKHLPATPGSIAGRCIMCSRETSIGLPPRFATKFTATEFLSSGDCLCPGCNLVYSTDELRHRMWVVDINKLQYIKHAEARSILLSPPVPPFVIYLTRTWKRQGWLRLIHRVSTSQKLFVVAEDMDLYFVDVDRLKYLSERADYYLKNEGISKTMLMNGHVSNPVFQRLSNPRAMLSEITKFVQEPLWQLAVWYSPLKSRLGMKKHVHSTFLQKVKPVSVKQGKKIQQRRKGLDRWTN